MDVTIMVCPSGRGNKPVRFLPKTHVISVPESIEGEEIVERFHSKLVDQYEGYCYTWESANATPDLLDKFERYVLACEEKRLHDRRTARINAAYITACRIYGDMMRLEISFRDFFGQLKGAVPGLTQEKCNLILRNAYRSGTMCEKSDFEYYIRQVCGDF